MKVLFVVRSTLHSNKGGDTIQILQTAHCLKELGVEVTVISTLEGTDYDGYDLLHFFNITRPADILKHIDQSKKPFVISPIFVDYSEFDRRFRKGLSGSVLRLLGPNGIEYAKTVARSILKGERVAARKYLIYGQKKSVKTILHRASMLLPNSYSEYNRLLNRYGIEKPFSVIPNAIGDLFIRAARNIPEKEPTLVLCVARIEGLKNQLNLIRALNNTAYTLVLIGQAATNQASYYRLCRQTAGSNVQFIPHLPQQELLAYYLRAKVHILPSWFETTGLSSLEAAALGCNIVITDKGDTREYFGDHAWYCDPSSPRSIRQAIEEAAADRSDGILQQKILEEYTWAQAALKTKLAYQGIIGHK
jgi:glycosyltransferase involved in cell wall biosynthesis